jgi:hypothetical protein
MKLFLPIAVLSAAALAAAPAAGATIPEKGSIAIFAAVGPVVPFEGDYDLGYQIEAGGEYYLSSVLSARATLGLARANGAGSSVTVGGLEVSAVYSTRRGKWAPFVLGGFGIHTVDPPADGPSQKLGLHVGGGAEYYLDRRTALTGQLTGRFIGSAGGRTSSYTSATVGIKYHF